MGLHQYWKAKANSLLWRIGFAYKASGIRVKNLYTTFWKEFWRNSCISLLGFCLRCCLWNKKMFFSRITLFYWVLCTAEIKNSTSVLLRAISFMSHLMFKHLYLCTRIVKDTDQSQSFFFFFLNTSVTVLQVSFFHHDLIGAEFGIWLFFEVGMYFYIDTKAQLTFSNKLVFY